MISLQTEDRFVRALTGSLLGLTGLVCAAQTAQPPKPPIAASRPNLLVIVLDDVGFADLGCYGSEIHTPAIDSLAHDGVRFTDFQTKAICAPTRASLLTGRNPQTVGMDDLPDAAKKDGVTLPKLTGIIPANAETLPEALRRVGYTTTAIGKWHLTPHYQDGTPGNNSTMPLQRGFDYFYGYKMGWTDQYHPALYEGNQPLPDPYHPGYFLAVDLADHAIAQMKKNQAEHPDRPMFTYLAFTFAHVPLQAPREYIDRYKGVYDKGWDRIREERFHRQLAMGLIPADTKLPPREAGDPAWDSLNSTQKKVYARFMEVYAGYIEHGDAQIGRVLAYMHATRLDKNTVVVLLSDNGAASETKLGSFHAYKEDMTVEQMAARLDELGGPTTQPHYPRPWAYAGGTPFRRYKLWPYFGGTRTPMIVDDPGKIRDPGSFRRQLVDAVDIAPTLLHMAGTSFASTLDGVAQIPVAGVNFLPDILSADNPAVRSVQFFEMRANRAIIDGDWRAVAMHKYGTPFEQDRWQLFNLRQDPSESTDVSKNNPAKLKQLQDLWLKEAKKYGALPLVEMPIEQQFSDAFID